MQEPATPADEITRLALLEAVLSQTPDPDDAFRGLTQLAADLAGTEWAFVSFVASATQILRASIGLTLTQSERRLSLCGHVISAGEPMIIPDTLEDPRFVDNPLILESGMRFYAGFPVIPDGQTSPVGTLCVADPVPRPEGLSTRVREQLSLLAGVAGERLQAAVEREELAAARESLEDAIQIEEIIGRITGVGFTLTDEDYRLRRANDYVARLLDTDRESLIGRSVLELVPPPERPVVKRRLDATLHQGLRWNIEWPLDSAEGTRNVARVLSERIVMHGHPYVFSVVQNATFELMQEALQALQVELLRLVTTQSPIARILGAIAETPRKMHPRAAVAVHHLAQEHLEADEIVGSWPALEEVLQGVEELETVSPWQHVIATAEPLLLGDGTELTRWPGVDRFVEQGGLGALWLFPIVDRERNVIGTLALMLPQASLPSTREARFLEQMASVAAFALSRDGFIRELQQRAFTDSLTGLGNRMLLDERLNQQLLLGRRHALNTAVLMLDLDDFKEINDEHGHAVGDAVLEQVAERLRRALRESDTPIRLGGDEFIVLLPRSSARAAVKVGERLLAALIEPYAVDGIVLTAPPSIGIAVSERGAGGTEALIRRADAAMYQAKLAGKGCLRVDDSDA